jgi:hypothetical protein
VGAGVEGVGVEFRELQTLTLPEDLSAPDLDFLFFDFLQVKT